MQGFKNQAWTREGQVWNQDRETTKEGVLALIADNSHTVAIFLKGEAVWKGEPEQNGEMVWIGEVDWTEEAHFIFNLKPPMNAIPS